MTRPDDTLGLYFHVPFCASRCPYCDFYSHCDPALLPAYVRALEAEVRTLAGCRAFTDDAVFARRVTSVYFGGGTPSLVSPAQIGCMLDAVRESFPLSPEAEITVECNPSVKEKAAYFAGLAAVGVNRVSVGLQSAVDAERRALGRLSGAGAVTDCIAAARAAGITELSLDLMLGIPGQTPETLRRSLGYCLEQGVPHLSAYLLKLEEGTVFYKKRETLALPDEDAAADLYLLLCDVLRARGWRHYEISNFCVGDRVGRHNLRYWQDREYLGFGPAAHSYYQGKRFYYADDLGAFLRGDPCLFEGTGGAAEEFLMLALRTDTGLDPSAFAEAFGLTLPRAFFRKTALLRAQGLLLEEAGRIRLTDRGMLVSNAVILALEETLS